MKKIFCIMLLCALLFQSTSALCDASTLKMQVWSALFPDIYTKGFSTVTLTGIYYKEPDPSLRVLSELAVFPDEEFNPHRMSAPTGSFDPSVQQYNDGFMNFGGPNGWAYVNAHCYPKHNEAAETLFLYIGLCVQGFADRIQGTPKLVIRMKNGDTTKPVRIEKLEVTITGKRKYTFHNAVQQNGNCLFDLGSTGQQLLQDMAGSREKDNIPEVVYQIYFDSFYFSGADLSAYPASIVNYLTSGEPYVARDRDNPSITVAEMAANLTDCKIYDYIDPKILQIADKQHNPTVAPDGDPV